MKNAMRLLPLITVAVAILCAAPALAFHDEGVAHCNGCHTMHNSYEGQLVDPDSPDGNDWLLVDATPSDTCLGCHSSANSSRGVLDGDCNAGHSREKGGGNYIFLSCPDLRESTRGSVIPGERAGHNLNAPGHGIATDTTLGAAPGGTFPASAMSCTSCHDPHGTFAFRLLYGVREVQGFYNFTNPPPVAVKNSGGAEAPNDHTAYNSGMSAWCGNCHTNFDEIGTTHKHVAGETIGAGIAMAYNLYNGSDDLTGGAAATAYWPEVPFEDADDTTYTPSSTQGPTGSSVVMCLTCHRSHATSAASAGRWDFNVTFNEEDGDAWGTFELAQRISNLSTNANRSLCNKCHVQDIDDEIKPDGGPY
jgi:hypothetical protein